MNLKIDVFDIQILDEERDINIQILTNIKDIDIQMLYVAKNKKGASPLENY